MTNFFAPRMTIGQSASTVVFLKIHNCVFDSNLEQKSQILGFGFFFAQFTQKRVKSERGQKVEEKFVCLTLTLLIVVRNWGHEELCNGLKVFLASQKSILCPRQDGKRAVRIAASYANYARCTHYPEYTSYTNVALHQA